MTRKAHWGAVLLAAGLMACSSSSSTTGGSTGGTGTSGSTGGSSGSTGDNGPIIVTVGGTAKVHPLATALYGEGKLAGTAPALPGLALRVDEPLQVILQTDHARLGLVTLDAAAKFSVPGVDTDNVIIGLVGVVVSPSPDGGIDMCQLPDGGAADAPDFCKSFVTTATSVFEGKPKVDVAGTTAYGIPLALEALLDSKLGYAPGNWLFDQGYVLGYVGDDSGAPTKGVSLDTSVNGTVPKVVYLDDDLNPIPTTAPAAQQVTNKYGVFLVIKPGNPQQYTHAFPIAGHTELGCHKFGSNPQSAFALVYMSALKGDCR
jgi:hypothetical protein